MRRLRWISGIVWIFCWYTVYLEVFRWHHMTKSLRFNPPPPIPGTNVQPKAWHAPYRGVPGFGRCSSGLHDSHDRESDPRRAWPSSASAGALGETALKSSNRHPVVPPLVRGRCYMVLPSASGAAVEASA